LQQESAALEGTFSDGTPSEALPPAPAIGTKNDQIGFPRIGMQHDYASWIFGKSRSTFSTGRRPPSPPAPFRLKADHFIVNAGRRQESCLERPSAQERQQKQGNDLSLSSDPRGPALASVM
jgi:hypothetical protein